MQTPANGEAKETFTPEEYAQVMELYRHYGNVRFAALTLFSAIVGGLLVAMKELTGSSTLPINKTFLYGFGFLASGVFWVMEFSAVLAWLHLARRAYRLEEALGYRNVYTLPDAPRFRKLVTTWAVAIFYWVTISFWGYLFVQSIVRPETASQPKQAEPAATINRQ